MHSTFSFNALKQPRTPAKESHVDVRFAMNTPLSVPISSRRSIWIPLMHLLVRGKLLKRWAAHVRVTVYNLRFKDYSINKKRWMQRRKWKISSKKSKMRWTTISCRCARPALKKKTRKTEEKKAERKAKMLWCGTRTYQIYISDLPLLFFRAANHALQSFSPSSTV